MEPNRRNHTGMDAGADLTYVCSSTTPSPASNAKGKKRARSSSVSNSGRRGSGRVESLHLKVGLSADLHEDGAY